MSAQIDDNTRRRLVRWGRLVIAGSVPVVAIAVANLFTHTMGGWLWSVILIAMSVGAVASMLRAYQILGVGPLLPKPAPPFARRPPQPDGPPRVPVASDPARKPTRRDTGVLLALALPELLLLGAGIWLLFNDRRGLGTAIILSVTPLYLTGAILLARQRRSARRR